jgi:hypothetical protein
MVEDGVTTRDEAVDLFPDEALGLLPLMSIA